MPQGVGVRVPLSALDTIIKTVTVLEIKQEKISDLTGKLTVVVTPEDYKGPVNTVLKDYAKRADINGFRKGKVPVAVVKKMFGKGVIFEELNKIVSAGLNDYVQEKQLKLVGEPLPVTVDMELDPEKDLDYELAFEFGTSSDFTVDFGLAGENPIYKVSADDKLIDREVEGMRTQHGEMSNPEASEPGDTLFGKLIEADKDGVAIEGGLERMFALNPERVKTKALITKMGKGQKEGDLLKVKMKDLFDNDAEIKDLWEKNVSGEQVREVSSDEVADIKKKTFNYEVRKINRSIKTEVNQELFDKVYGEGTVPTEADFRDKIGGDIEGHLNGQATKLYRSQTIRALVEGTDIQVPDEFLKKWLISTREKITEENIDETYTSYIRSLKWRMIVEEMQAQDETVKVSQEDIVDRARQMVTSQFGKMMGEGNEAQTEQFVQYYLQDEKMVQKLFDEELEDRVFKFIVGKNPPVEDEVTGTDFIEKLKEENAK